MKNKETLEEVAETAEEYFLSCIKNMLQFNNDALAIRFMEKYYHAKQEQERSYSEEDLKQFAFECVANFLSNNDNKVEIKLVDVIIDRVNDKFKQFKNK
jgi:6-phosphogluconate dehydrogenase